MKEICWTGEDRRTWIARVDIEESAIGDGEARMTLSWTFPPAGHGHCRQFGLRHAGISPALKALKRPLHSGQVPL